MQKTTMKKPAAIPALLVATTALLSVLTGCFYNLELPPRFVLENITVLAGNTARGSNGHYFLSPAETETFTADAAGADATGYEWSVISGTAFVEMQTFENIENTAFITATGAGEARIKVRAFNDESETETVFYIHVVSTGAPEWTFLFLDGATEIHDNLTIIMENGWKNITLSATTDNVIFANWASSDISTVTVSMGSNNASLDITGAQRGSSIITVTATKNSATVIRTFTVTVKSTVPDPNVLFEWNSVDTPMTGAITAATPKSSGYNNVSFRAAMASTCPITTSGGAFVVAGTGSGRPVFIIGGTAASSANNTSSTNHVAGVFDLTQTPSFKLTINYKNAVFGDGDEWIRIHINSNMFSSNNSVLSNTNNLDRLRHYTVATNGQLGEGTITGSGVTQSLTANQIVITVTPATRWPSMTEAQSNSLKTAFISIPITANSSITITGIRIEKLP